MAPLIKDYLKKTQEYKKEYGENTLILMQVGAFFEVYGLQDKNGIISMRAQNIWLMKHHYTIWIQVDISCNE